MSCETLTACDETVLVEVVEGPLQLVEVTKQGPPGPPGQAGVSYFSYTADGPLGGHRVVVMTGPDTVGYADNMNVAHANAVVGITIAAAVDGAQVQVQNAGKLVEPSWNWTLQLPVFLAADGLLTQTPPLDGFCLTVGKPTSPTTLLIEIKSPFLLEN